MLTKSCIALLFVVSAVVVPGFTASVTYADDNATRETVGEKIDDATITSKVKLQLLNNRGTSALHTDVDTKNGVVTLTGKAKSAAEKDLATELAKKVKGVKKVINDIAVEPQ